MWMACTPMMPMVHSISRRRTRSPFSPFATLRAVRRKRRRVGPRRSTTLRVVFRTAFVFGNEEFAGIVHVAAHCCQRNVARHNNCGPNHFRVRSIERRRGRRVRSLRTANGHKLRSETERIESKRTTTTTTIFVAAYVYVRTFERRTQPTHSMCSPPPPSPPHLVPVAMRAENVYYTCMQTYSAI